MIHAKFYCVDPEGSLHMVMWGHAGAAPKGQDLVCAGASVVACALAEGMEMAYEQGMLRRYPRIVLQAGKAEVIALPKTAFFRDVLMLFWMAEVAMNLLGREFPQNVSLEESLRVHKEGEER